MPVTYKDLRSKAEELHPYMIRIRRHLHQNPEISFNEYDTTNFILTELEKLGIPTEQPLKTGCVGMIEGKNEGRVTALRADIDALSMDEEGDFKKDFLSRRPGAAHCCGHDAHTANLLGVAKLLAEYSDQVKGKVLLIFQPGEEKLPGGGRLLCETGFLQNQGVEAIFGLHTSPLHNPGTVVLKEGPMMARPDEFEVELIGEGGHAASPHLTVDPIVMAAEAVTRIQTIVSRSIDPVEPAVVTVGKIQAGSTFNVIPEKAYLIGTVRTFSREVSMNIRDRMETIIKGIANGAGGSYKFQFNEGYPAVVNDEKLIEELGKAGRRLFGSEQVLEMEKPVMAGEDFAFYQQHFPGAFFLLGSGSRETESTWSWHHPKYNVDERCFLTGAPLMASLVLNVE
ncbi:MAG: M20 family metallopeptidase [Balneolaceae bacterium]